MQNLNALSPRRSIRTRLLLFLLGLTIVAVVLTAYLGANSTLTAGETAQEASRDTLRTQNETFLIRLNNENAQQRNLILEHVQQDAQTVADYASNIFAVPNAFAPDDYWQAETEMYRGTENGYRNDLDDVTTVWVPNTVAVDDDFNADLELSAYMDFIFQPVYDSDTNTVAIYIIGKQEYSRLYPNIGLGDIVPPDFTATEDIFFVAGSPENNPEREVVWTPVYDDPAGQGLLVSAIAPIYSQSDEFLGVIGIDVSLVNLTANIEAEAPIAGGYSFLIDQDGRALALPAQGYNDILGRAPAEDDFGIALTTDVVQSEFEAILANMQAEQAGFQTVNVNGRELFIAYTPLESTGWGLATVADAQQLMSPADTLQEELENSTQEVVTTTILPAGAIILLMAALIGLWISNRLVVPIQELAVAAQQIGAGEWDTPLPTASEDEIGILSGVFGTMAQELKSLVSGLEQRVAERTRDLSVAADVSKQITTELELNQLLQKVVQLTVPGFNLYNASIFLLETERETLELTASADEMSKLLPNDIIPPLPIAAEPSVIALAARNRKAVLVDDVTTSPAYKGIPELPETRSEAAIPILLGERLLGVFDLQSRLPNRFTKEDLRVLTTLAEQVAVAVRNAQLFTEAANAREEAELANKVKSQFLANMSHELRTPLNAIINFTGFVADGLLGPLNDEQTENLQKSLDSSEHLLNLINDILDLSKIEVGMMELFLQEIDMNSLLTNITATARGLASNKSVDVHTHIEEDLPKFQGDKRRVRQVLLNLVSNAVKFTNEGTIHIEAKYREEEIYIAVKDTGVGIDAKNYHLVFESFGQASHNMVTSPSTGLGMPISKYFVEAHGGKIWFESEAGKGSAFFVTFPINGQSEQGEAKHD